MSTPTATPTPEPWIADGYDLRQKNGRMIAYFGPHHTPADEYPMSCRLQDEANCQWCATARNELAAEHEKVCVLREALRAIVRQSVEDYDERDPFYGVSLTARAALAATKEGSK